MADILIDGGEGSRRGCGGGGWGTNVELILKLSRDCGIFNRPKDANTNISHDGDDDGPAMPALARKLVVLVVEFAVHATGVSTDWTTKEDMPELPCLVGKVGTGEGAGEVDDVMIKKLA